MDGASGLLGEVYGTQYQPGSRTGHYESFFVRANHPSRPLAFWIRYTVFSPQGKPEDAIAELWAVAYDGETRRHVAVKTECPIAEARFASSELRIQIGDAYLQPGRLAGSAASGGHQIEWLLSYDGRADPIFLLPAWAYRGPFPRAKSLVALPMARFSGLLRVDGRRVEVQGWAGSQNHNWGSQHTDRYAWGQVAGFDTHPDSFLEVATAQVRIGRFWTPPMTPIVLRHQGREYALTGLARSLRARGAFSFFDWTFTSRSSEVAIEGRMTAPASSFLGLNYRNPPGGIKQCLASKLGSCEVRLTERGRTEVLRTDHRAAFEILTDSTAHGIPVQV